MKKSTRDLKKHYRWLERTMREFMINLSDEFWYDTWHQHLDFDGITNTSEKQRRNHILCYFQLLDKIEDQANNTTKPFQTWIYLDSSVGCYDAVFVHTSNPNRNSEFPLVLEVDYNCAIPELLAGLIDLSIYTLGRMKSLDDGGFSYVIQKKGLGLELK